MNTSWTLRGTCTDYPAVSLVEIFNTSLNVRLRLRELEDQKKRLQAQVLYVVATVFQLWLVPIGVRDIPIGVLGVTPSLPFFAKLDLNV